MGANINAIKRLDLIRVVDSITRPANVTAYAAGDAVSEVTSNDYFTFEGIFAQGGKAHGEILTAKLHSSGVVATSIDAELFLFRAAITEVADNAAWDTITDTQMLTLIAKIDFPIANFYVGANSSVCEVRDLNLPFTLDQVGSTRPNLIGQLVSRNAYMPITSEVFTVELMIRRDTL